jgi:hypothetical protein
MDKRKNNGGHKTAGRKSKAEELSLVKLGTDAIESVYGSQAKYWEHVAKESKESMAHLKLLSEYVYGKPKETKDIKIQNVPVIDMSTWK